MDIQDHGKNHSGHESHGVYLCKKCGWPFPNPHPSAKHRRAHRNICGTIEGYNLGDSTHSSASDDDPLSDEDQKTTIAKEPKVMGSRIPEQNIGGIGGISNRSEDEVFSDATVEFQDSGSGLGRLDSLDNAGKADNIVEKDLTATISFKECEDADAIQSPMGSTDSCQTKVLVTENMPTLLSGTLEEQGLGLSYNKDADDKNSSACDELVKTDTLAGVSEKSSEVSALHLPSEVEPGTDASENDEGKLNKNLGGGLLVPSEGDVELFESVPLPEKRDTVVLDNTVHLTEESSDMLASTSSMSEHGEPENDGKSGSGIKLERNLMDVVASDIGRASVTSERREDITWKTEPDSKLGEADENTDKLAVNMTVDKLSPEVQCIKHTDSSANISEVKINSVQDTEAASPVNSSDVNDKKEIENESVYVLSVPDDIPVIKEAERKLEDFKDNQGVQLPHLGVLASEEIITNKKDDVKEHASQDTYQSNKLDDDKKVDTLDKNVLDDNEAVVKEALIEGKADMLQTKKGSDALRSAVTEVEAENSNNVVGSDDMGITESVRIGILDDGRYMKNTETSCESANSFTVSHTNSTSNNSDDISTRKAEKGDTNVAESGEGPEGYLTRKAEKDDTNVVESGEGPEGYLSVKPDSRSEPIRNHQQSSDVTEEVNNEYVRILPETEGPQSRKVSISQDEVNGGNKVQGECTGEAVVSSALDHREGNYSKRTSEDQLQEEVMHLPPDANSISQSNTGLEDSHATKSGLDASEVCSINLQGQSENVSVKNQFDTTLVDVSVESSSQTDSLDAHWGSISVLSTQSDNPAVIDTDNVPATGSHALLETDKDNLKKPKSASEEQHFDEPDEFEPPSFMTLVEPGAGDQKAAVDSEIQTEQNDQKQSPLQAVWFPSLTHVANESPGRKKNEEIIAKVTNWNTKQHTPLKNLLGEAERETKPKSPNFKPTIVIPREENVSKENGALGTKVSSIPGPEAPVAQPTNMEAGKEWKSPARYPADIKGEKRKVKGRPLWVQFVCCSSVN